MRKLFTMLPVIILLCGCGYESAFKQAAVDKPEILVIPASTVMQTKAEGDYFAKSDELFIRLFRYIQKNEVSMTVPVEAGMNDAAMTFYVGPGDITRNLTNSTEVAVLKLPERLVARIGGRGSYTKKNLETAEKKLAAWIETQKQYQPAGKSYGVFWNSPFVPGFIKRYEIHIPVRKADLKP